MLGHVGGFSFGRVGALFGRVGVTFWSGRGHFFVKFGMSWDVSGSGLGTFLDRFGKVWEKLPTRSEKNKIFKHAREYFS